MFSLLGHLVNHESETLVHSWTLSSRPCLDHPKPVKVKLSPTGLPGTGSVPPGSEVLAGPNGRWEVSECIPAPPSRTPYN